MGDAIHVEHEQVNAYPADLTFHDLIRKNKRNSALLMSCMIALLIALGVAIPVIFLAAAGSQNSGVDAAQLVRSALLGAGVAAVVAAIGSAWSWFSGASAIVSITGAQPLEKAQDPQLYNVVDELRLAAGIPMPKIYLIDDPALNAFATGRDPQHGIVAITTGLRNMLDRDELAGVIAHELSHIRHYDIRFTMLMATMVGMIVMLADVSRLALHGLGRGSSRSSSKKGDGGVIVAVLIVLVLSIVAGLLARFIQLAISRQREYLADAGAVELTRYPRGLASALSKLATHNRPMQNVNRAVAHLFIVNPMHSGETWHNIDTAFRTHPPIQERITRLLALDR